MRGSSFLAAPCAALLLLTASACRGCRTGQASVPSSPPVTPKATEQPPNITMDYGKALDVMHEGFGFTIYPGDCKLGTGPDAKTTRPDGTIHWPPCEPTDQYKKRLDALQQKGRPQ